MIKIIPKPLKMQEKEGVFNYTFKTTVGGCFPDAQAKLIEFFAVSGVEATKVKDKSDVTFVYNEKLDKEGYFINVDINKIVINASDEAGAFYAVQTLRQASKVDLLSDVQSVAIPCFVLEDKPRFAHRAFMLDVARHFFSVDIIKQTLDMMALNKLNVFHWHLTEDQGWRIEIKKYPELTKKGAVRASTALNSIGYAQQLELHDDHIYGEGLFYTQEQIKEVVSYAQDLHINIIPEVDMPGHLVAAISCYPELSCEGKQIDVSDRWGVMDTIGCVGGDKLIPFVKDVIDELVQLFPYEYFHIGGDEVPKTKWKTCPKCQAKIKQLGLANENELQGWFNNQILQYLKTKGKFMIGWNEILEASELSNETIVQWWVGNAKKNGVAKWLEKGNKVVLSPCEPIYADYFYSMKDLKTTYSLDLKTVGLKDNFENRVLGIEMPVWTEYVRSVGKLHFNTYPRLQALAEINWTAKEQKDFDDFENRLSVQFEIMDNEKIGYAPREAYMCRGFKNRKRVKNAWKEWRADPDTEYKKYKKQ